MDQNAALSLTGDDRLHPTRPLLAASLAVIRGDRVLLARRAAAPLAGRFTLPGGLVEPGESLADAALRETREEVGVASRILGFNRHVEVVMRDEEGRVRHHYVIASFVGVWLSGEGTAGPEAEAVIWARREAVHELSTTEHLADVLDGAFAIARTLAPPC